MTSPHPLRKRLLQLLATLALSLVLGFGWALWLDARSGQVIFQDCSGGFCLRVAEGGTQHELFSREQLYEIWITRQHSPNYGYVLHHSFAFAGSFDDAVTIRKSQVTWSPEGVTLLEPSGQRVFVPYALYRDTR
ncbi:MAG TPA: hypothetical protein VN764_08125 [Polyangiaceae bacterium]|nr:hypothetical protein [Polyangiaceae bacterium]